MNFVDLHFHTNNSDGAFSTKEILSLCEENNIKIISITDHDSIGAYLDIKKENITFNGKIITGIELSFNKNGCLYDVLGYNVDINIINEWLNSRYSEEENIKNQQRILNDMKALYKKLNIKFNDSLVVKTGKKSEAYNLIKHSCLEYAENKIIAPELFEDMFYKKYHTNKNSKFYIDETKNLPSLKECLDIIHKANGISSLAHSGAYGFNEKQMTDFIQYAVDNGVKGLELKYNCHTKNDEELILKFAKKYNLYLTGGSDFHGGKIKPSVKLGKVYGDKYIEQKEFSKFLNEVKTKNEKTL